MPKIYIKWFINIDSMEIKSYGIPFYKPNDMID